jgi:hypothetical protein
MYSLTAGRRRRRISKRMAASLVALAVIASAAGAASASGAASSSTAPGVVHAHIDRSGTVVVTGYDGGVAVATAASMRH